MIKSRRKKALKNNPVPFWNSLLKKLELKGYLREIGKNMSEFDSGTL